MIFLGRFLENKKKKYYPIAPAGGGNVFYQVLFHGISLNDSQNNVKIFFSEIMNCKPEQSFLLHLDPKEKEFTYAHIYTTISVFCYTTDLLERSKRMI